MIEKRKSENKIKLSSPQENILYVKNVNLSNTNADIPPNTINISDIQPSNINDTNKSHTKTVCFEARNGARNTQFFLQDNSVRVNARNFCLVGNKEFD